MRAIDADPLKAEAKDQLVAYFLVIKSWVPTYGETTIMDIIDCKDPEYYEYKGANGFCSRGERKDEAKE